MSVSILYGSSSKPRVGQPGSNVHTYIYVHVTGYWHVASSWRRGGGGGGGREGEIINFVREKVVLHIGSSELYIATYVYQRTLAFIYRLDTYDEAA